MIPFYFFRRKAISPVASLYHSELMDKVDYWGKVDRLAILDEVDDYIKKYAMDWALTIGLFCCFCASIGCLLCVLLNIPYHFDIEFTLLAVCLSFLLPYTGALHIIGQYREALEFSGGGNV